jgi:hypothetical protein
MNEDLYIKILNFYLIIKRFQGYHSIAQQQRIINFNLPEESKHYPLF